MTTLVRDGLALHGDHREPARVRGSSRLDADATYRVGNLVGEPIAVVRAVSRSEAARSDPAAWAYLDSRFDDRAALAFSRELSELPADSLVNGLACPHIDEIVPSGLAWLDRL